MHFCGNNSNDMKTLKNLLKTETLNVNELMEIKGAAQSGSQQCKKLACSMAACTFHACIAEACSKNACSNSSCSCTVCKNSGCTTGTDKNLPFGEIDCEEISCAD
jgi:hypothetical protein